LNDTDRLEVIVVHLPVAADERLPCRFRHYGFTPFRRAASPGRSPCSMSSSDAPPPVEMWSMYLSSLNWATAAALSPPPITVKARSASAHAWPTARVPDA